MDDLVFHAIVALLASIVAISEYLPFSTCDYNGIFHAIVVALSSRRKDEPIMLNIV